MEAETRSPSAKFWWSISNFSQLTRRKYYSDSFTAGRYKWRIMVYPKGDQDNSGRFSIYLKVADFGTLPTGWSIDAEYTLSLVNQLNETNSTRKDTRHEFSAQDSDSWGYSSFKRLADIHDSKKGYLVNDTIIVEADVFVHNLIAPPTPPQVDELPSNTNSAIETNRFDSFFHSLEEFVNKKKTCSSSTEEEGPSLEQVELAKKSLKACLSDLFKLNMTERLTAAMSTLSCAKNGLSNEQRRSIHEFMANFDQFVSDYLMFEQENSEFELQKLCKDQMYSVMKKNHATHIQNKKLLDNITKEEEDLNKKIEEIKCRKAKLLVDWECMVSESDEAKKRCAGVEQKVAEAEEKKRIAEERMSRSAAAWSSLKAHFIN